MVNKATSGVLKDKEMAEITPDKTKEPLRRDPKEDLSNTGRGNESSIKGNGDKTITGWFSYHPRDKDRAAKWLIKYLPERTLQGESALERDKKVMIPMIEEERSQVNTTIGNNFKQVFSDTSLAGQGN